MQNFTYHCPTEIVFGRNAEMQVANMALKYGASKVFILYGGGSAVRSGLLARVADALQAANLACQSLGGVRPNPRLSLVREGIRQAAAFGADLILAIGGGSVIDTAKGIAHGVANPQTDVWEFWTGAASLEWSLPIGVILTIPAAGSETSQSAVLTNEATGQKWGLGTQHNRPKFALMNPELTFSLSKHQIACGIVDILMHTLDRYFTPTKGNMMTDEIADALLRVTMKNGTQALQNPQEYEAMSELMWCGSLSHNGLTGLGAEIDFGPHKLGHELSGKFDVAHGESLSAIWGSWAKYVYREDPLRFAQFAFRIWNIRRGKVEEGALAGIDAMVAYFKSLGMPTCLSELGIGIQEETTLEELADRCSDYGNHSVAKFKVLEREDILQIYRLANH